MNDKTLVRISLGISLIGVLGLFLFVQTIEPLNVEVSRIDDSMIGKSVEVSGNIDSFSVKEGNVFLTIDDGTGKISVVMFERDARRNSGVYSLKEGGNVTVSGKIALYRSELEIIADSIEGD